MSRAIRTGALAWFRRVTAPMRCLPDYIIIGGQKCGTRSLYTYLCRHPQVLPAAVKEVHCFDANVHRGENWYRAHFPTRFERRLRAVLRGRPVLTGEASPAYLFHPLAAERIARLVPKVKLIALLRNPTDRAVSQYHHNVERNREPLPMQEAIDAEEGRIGVEWEKTVPASAPMSRNVRQFSYCHRGLYAEQIKRYLDHFPRNQVLVLKSEDMFADPPTVFREVCEFLGLESWALPGMEAENRRNYDRTRTAVHEKLDAYFGPHNRRLYTLIGRDMGW